MAVKSKPPAVRVVVDSIADNFLSSLGWRMDTFYPVCRHILGHTGLERL